MNDSLLMNLLYLAAAAYVGYLYWTDTRAALTGQPNPRALPGAVPAGWLLILTGLTGGFILLGLETLGEVMLGIAGEQSEIVWYLLFAIVAAGIVEEVIFRGYLVVENRGRAALIASCVGFSLIFAVIHPHLWSLDEGFAWNFTTKAFFSTAILFLNSLWFYALRFGPWNTNRSILPCMIAHAASNLGVFAVKFAQGYVIF